MEEMIKIEELEGEDCLKLRDLWEEVFWEDSQAFTDYYFQEKAVRNHAFALKNGQEYVAMLYLSPYPVMLRAGKQFVCREINYIVGVATKKEYRHRGYMDRLLKEALAFIRAKGQPFVFLMPADPRIYMPYQFTYIYDRGIYRMRAENNSPEIRSLTEEEFHILSDCASSFLKEHCDVFIRRDSLYYRGMEKELRVQNGGICFRAGTGKEAEGYFFYTEEEGKGEILEAVLPKGDGEWSIYNSGKKEPAIMGRIVDVKSMLSLMRAKKEEIFCSMLIKDPIFPENEGIWKCRVTVGEAFINKEEKGVLDGGKQPGYECEAGIEQLTAWVFGYKEAEESFRFSDKEDREATICKLRGIRRLCRVFINEIV